MDGERAVKKINWDEQPTPEHCWAEDLTAVKYGSSGWCTKNECGFWDMDDGIVKWTPDAEEKGDLRIYKRPETIGELGLTGQAVGIGEEPYQPEVGECEYSTNGVDWEKCFFIGTSKDGRHVYEARNCTLYRSDGSVSFRPIKSERDQFIEKSKELRGGIYGEGAIFGKLYDNGARFTDDNS